jgi:hypothetical protein
MSMAGGVAKRTPGVFFKKAVNQDEEARLEAGGSGFVRDKTVNCVFLWLLTHSH